MKSIGIASWCLSNDPRVALEMAVSSGFKKIQLNMGNPTSPYFLGKKEILLECRKIINEKNLQITALSVNHLNYYSLETTEINLTLMPLDLFLEKTFLTLNFLKIPALLCPSFKVRRVKNKNQKIAIASFFKNLCKIDSSLLVCSENTLSSSENISLINSVGSENFRINFDSYNPILFQHNPNSMLLDLYDFCFHQVHIKDGKEGEMGNVFLGEGVGHVDVILKTLQSLNFSGDYILENKYFTNSNKLTSDIQYLMQFVQKKEPQPNGIPLNWE